MEGEHTTGERNDPLAGRSAVSVAEMAKQLSISRAAGYNLVDSGRIRSIRIGARIVVPVDAIRALLAPPASDQQRQQDA